MKINLFYIFLALFLLKIFGVLNWSWWLITSPLWVPFVIFAVAMSIVVILITLATIAVTFVTKEEK